MAGVDVIEAAIGIMLLLIVSYTVVGSITTAAATVNSAQNDEAQILQARSGTKIDLADADIWWDTDHHELFFSVRNTGNTIIPNVNNIGVIIVPWSPEAPTYYPSGTGSDNTWECWGFYQDQEDWTDEYINPGQWDPGEYMYGFIDNIPDWYEPDYVYVVTGTGETDSIRAE